MANFRFIIKKFLNKRYRFFEIFYLMNICLNFLKKIEILVFLDQYNLCFILFKNNECFIIEDGIRDKDSKKILLKEKKLRSFISVIGLLTP